MPTIIVDGAYHFRPGIIGALLRNRLSLDTVVEGTDPKRIRRALDEVYISQIRYTLYTPDQSNPTNQDIAVDAVATTPQADYEVRIGFVDYYNPRQLSG